MDKKEMLKSMMSLKSKLMATVSMLLVSAILLTNVSYAWFVLSTAPEVSGVSTTTGANGALEIALQSTNEAGNGRAEAMNDIGDSSSLATQDVSEANVTWGNIVDVTNGYGLDKLVLYPSRLNLNINDTVVRVNTTNYLTVPRYGTDGRISSLSNAVKAHYISEEGNESFSTNFHRGVNIHGTKEDLEDASTQIVTKNVNRDDIRKTAVAEIESQRDVLRTEMENLLDTNGENILIMAANVLGQTLTTDDHKTITNIVVGLKSIAMKAETSLKWALLANAVSDTVNYNQNDSVQMEKLGQLYNRFSELTLNAANGDSVRSIALANSNTEDDAINQKYRNLVEAIDTLLAVQSRIGYADDLIKRAEDENNPNLYGNAAATIINPAQVSIVFEVEGETYDYPAQVGLVVSIATATEESDMYFVGGTDMEQNNLFSAMAVILGDYSQPISAIMSYDEINEIIIAPDPNGMKYTYDVKATSKDSSADFSVATNTGVLYSVLRQAAQMSATGFIPIQIERADVTAYGYSIDLLLRSSANGKLLLQQAGASRISGQDTVEDLMGKGSNMSFSFAADMSVSQVTDLMNSIYVVFMDSTYGTIYAVGCVNSNVTIDANGKASADLTLYQVDNVLSAKTGVLQLGRAIDENVLIDEMVADTEYEITALVYLDGDALPMGVVSSNDGISLQGSINLQFATDAELTPMEYKDYYVAPTESQAAGG